MLGMVSASNLLLLAMGACSTRSLSAAPVTAQSMQRAASYCDEGVKALNVGDVAKAKSRYEKALGLVPSFPDAHMGMGHVAMKKGQFEEALKEFERAKDSFRELGAAIFDLQVKRFNDTQRQIGSLRDTLRSYQNALVASQRSAAGRSDTTIIDRQIVQIEEAIRRLEAVQMPIREAPHDPPGEVFFHLGNAQFRLGRLDEALASWETCAAKSPKFAMVQNNLTVAYWKKGRFEDARKSLARAEELGFPVDRQMKADLEQAAASAAAQPSKP